MEKAAGGTTSEGCTGDPCTRCDLVVITEDGPFKGKNKCSCASQNGKCNHSIVVTKPSEVLRAQARGDSRPVPPPQ
jgi:hypothetical protein